MWTRPVPPPTAQQPPASRTRDVALKWDLLVVQAPDSVQTFQDVGLAVATQGCGRRTVGAVELRNGSLVPF